MTEEEKKTLGQMKMYAELDMAMKERERAKSMRKEKLPGFMFYRDYAEAVRKMPEGRQLATLWALIDYGLDGEEKADGDWSEHFAVEVFRSRLDRSREIQNDMRGQRL